MNHQVFNNLSLELPAESDWLPVKLRGQLSAGRELAATSVQFSWTGASGDSEGIITVYGSNDMNLVSFEREYYPELIRYSDGSLLIIIYPLFAYIKFKYSGRIDSGGIINSVLFYD
ncbi:MAG: hypothetical protein QG635_1576 [Bacteroidota bacterium]|nr:hypothetical protein [Bacteroidota bacterium]